MAHFPLKGRPPGKVGKSCRYSVRRSRRERRPANPDDHRQVLFRFARGPESLCTRSSVRRSPLQYRLQWRIPYSNCCLLPLRRRNRSRGFQECIPVPIRAQSR